MMDRKDIGDFLSDDKHNYSYQNNKIKTRDGEEVNVKILSLSPSSSTERVTLNNEKFPKKERFFIFVGEGTEKSLTKALTVHGLNNNGEDYIISVELCDVEEDGDDFVLPTTVSLPAQTANNDLNQVFDNLCQKIKNNPGIGIYRESVKLTKAKQSYYLVLIRIKENNKDETKYLDAYLTSSDSRTYHGIKYTYQISDNKSNWSPSTNQSDWPHNVLVFGAPGTGKSYSIQEKIKNLRWESNMQRVTFYEDYSYEKFVGAYMPKKGEKETKTYDTSNSPETYENRTVGDGIVYEFRPGVFLKMLVDAWFEWYYKTQLVITPVGATALGDGDDLELSDDIQKSPEDDHKPHEDSPETPKNELESNTESDQAENYVLVIEEINRANAASVFGDMFQLLDRDEDGKSEYNISLSDEMKEWLEVYLEGKVKEKLSSIDDDSVENIISKLRDDFRIPPNMYIWATMNSADQGVFPLDSAFKRRWSYIYKSASEPTEADGTKFQAYWKKTGNNEPEHYNVRWGDFKNAINQLMGSSDYNIEEDRFIGPWYFKASEFTQIDEFTNAEKEKRWNMPNPLCDKLFHYLRQDVFRNHPSAIFQEGYTSLFAIREGMCNGKGLNEILKFDQDLERKLEENLSEA